MSCRQIFRRTTMFETLEPKDWCKWSVIAIIIIAILLLNIWFINKHISSNPEKISNYSLRDTDINKTREAAVAGLFYPADMYQLEREVDKYLQLSAPKLHRRPHIMIVPHAGYMYSAEVAAKAYQQLLPFEKEIEKVLILGPAHRVPVKGVALSSAEYFKTPLGDVAVNQEISQKLAASPLFEYNNLAHKDEHSLEVQLPFLQKTLKNFSIVPMVYGEATSEEIVKALHPLLLDNRTLLVISADLSHYLDDATARVVDEQTTKMVESGTPLDEHRSCGSTGINTAISLAKKEGLKPFLIDMSNSGDVSGSTASVVGYASWIFAGEPAPKPKLSNLEQEVENIENFVRHNKNDLLQIVKRALDKAVNQKHYTPDRKDYPDVLFNKGATFVTLTKNGELRGCIGSLLPNRAVAHDLAQNAFEAANKDSRFNPLQKDELPETSFSLSFLTGYEKIEAANEDDLLNKITPDLDGLVLRDGNRQGLFLPSVWKQLPNKKEFLSNLKIKAGLSPSYWSNNMKIYRFRTVEISENEI